MAVPTQSVIDPPLNDPVTKAVVDNIMGNLPTKKPHVRCNDCDLCFTSQTVFECHLRGARHAKQIRSKVIMATLEEAKVAFTKDQEANSLRCNICNVCLNSIQQLQTHLNGNRHKKKIMKGGWSGIEVTQGSSPASSCATNLNVPGSVKGICFSCDACNKFFNSKAQYDVHVASNKHTYRLNRLALKSPKKKRFFPYWKKSKAVDVAESKHPVQSLASNVVPGGYVNTA